MRRFLISFQNLLLFVILALWHRTPFHLWSLAWHKIQEEHVAQVRRGVWELKKRGEVRQDKDGRLWINKR